MDNCLARGRIHFRKLHMGTRKFIRNIVICFMHSIYTSSYWIYDKV